MNVFLLSTGRTGTVFLNKVLSSIPDITSNHEKCGHLLRILSNFRMRHGDKPILQGLAELYVSKHTTPCNNWHFEINSTLSYANRLVNFFPEAIYIHMVRDPKSFVRSGVNWALNDVYRTFLDLHFPYWTPRPAKYMLSKSTQSRLFEIVTNQWVQYNEVYSSIEGRQYRYYLLTFEDFRKDPVKFITNILDIIGYYPTKNISERIRALIENTPKNSSVKTVGSWQDWNDDYVLYLHNRCGDLMKKYGYGEEPEWKQRLRLAQKNED